MSGNRNPEKQENISQDLETEDNDPNIGGKGDSNQYADDPVFRTFDPRRTNFEKLYGNDKDKPQPSTEPTKNTTST